MAAHLPVHLHTTTFHCIFDNGMIRSLHAGTTEIVRRVYFALRDQHWNTIPYAVSSVQIDQRENSFMVTFDARHKKGEMALAWRGTIEGTADNAMQFAIEAHAESSFLRNRIGLCLLFPLGTCASLPCTVEQSDGTVSSMTFPDECIAPFQPVVNMQAMKFTTRDNIRCSILFSGDIFEMEDQRNWTDASFKAYSTPLAAPIPVQLHNGDRIAQSIRIAATGTPVFVTAPSAPLQVSYAGLHRNMQPLPSIGIGNAYRQATNAGVVGYMTRCRFRHLRMEMSAASDLTDASFAMAAAQSAALQLPLELAIYFSEHFRDEISMAAALIARHNLPIRQLLIQSTLHPLPPAAMIGHAAQLRRFLLPGGAWYCGSGRYFADCNRSFERQFFDEGVCFSANPQVHTFDNGAIMENCEGLYATIMGAKRRTGDIPVAISPLTLRPRALANRPEKDGGADYRQQTLFGAAWCAGALCAAVSGGAASITLFSALAGDEGIMSEELKTLFPVFHVVSSGLLAARSCSARLLGNPSPQAAVLLFTHDVTTTLLVANLTDLPQTFIITDVNGECTAACLDDSNVKRAAQNPDFWCESTFPLDTKDLEAVIELPGYALIRIDMRG